MRRRLAVIGDQNPSYETHKGIDRVLAGTMFQPQMSPQGTGRLHPLLEAFQDAVSGPSHGPECT